MKNKITIIGVNYFPENTSTGLYTTQLAEYLSNSGIEVSVICGFPYYPAWKINNEYSLKKTFIREQINGVSVFRYKQYVPKNPKFIKRVIHLIDFTLGSLINVLKIKKTDVVLCVVPFTSNIFLGSILSKITKAKLWVHIQDFEFDLAIETMTSKKKEGFLFKTLLFIEKKLLNKADITSTISNSMLEKLQNKTKNNKPKLLLPNWVDIKLINPKNALKHNYLNSDKFKLLYSGNIGEKQDWESFILFAKELEKHQENIEIIIIGDGGKRKWLQEKTKSIKIIKHYLPVSYEELPNVLCSANLHILFQKEKIKNTVMPSKILAMMASERPSLITGNPKSEVAKIMRDSNGGKYFRTQQIKEAVNFALKLKKNSNLANKYGENARKYISLHFSYKEILKNFKETFQEITK